MKAKGLIGKPLKVLLPKGSEAIKTKIKGKKISGYYYTDAGYRCL